jgi:DTW domain-containing protein YfiP
MSLIREIIILDCHSRESGNPLNTMLWIPDCLPARQVFTVETNEKQNLNQGFNIFRGSIY